MENWTSGQWITFLSLIILGALVFGFLWNTHGDPPSDFPGGDGA